jgi:DNA-directed RNA polymerase subunit RPC12/RpoP
MDISLTVRPEAGRCSCGDLRFSHHYVCPKCGALFCPGCSKSIPASGAVLCPACVSTIYFATKDPAAPRGAREPEPEDEIRGKRARRRIKRHD